MRNLRFAAVIVGALICAGQVSEAQTATLFGNAVPSTPVDSDTAAVTLGVKFWSSQPGTVAGIRFYRGYKASSSGYTVKLFSAGGTLLASARTGKDTCAVPCWEEVNFASPLSIAANTTYVAAYYTGNGRYADDQYGLANGITSGRLVAPASGQVGGNGVYAYSTGFPMQTWNASNYYVDISFTPTATPVPQTPKAVLFSPASPVNVSDSAPAGTAIAAIQVTTSDGNPFDGTVAISAQSVNGMLSLSSSAVPSNVQVASINSSDDGAQTVSVQACENGICTSPATLAMNVVRNQSDASITGLSLSNTTIAGGAPDGTLVGNITATTSDLSTPVLSLIGVQTGSGNDASSFRISSSQLLTNTATGATDQPGQYNICIIASGNYSNSPQQICPTIQATGPGGAGWQLTFSDEFVCPNNMLECLATYPVTSYSWANSVCSGIRGAAGCGTAVTSSPVATLSSANCTGTRLGSCSISIAGATNNGTVDAIVNGAFLVVGVSADQKTLSLYMPYSGIGTIGFGGATLGTGPWTQSIVHCPANCGIQPNPTMDFSNNASEGWDAHAVTVDANGLSITTRNAPFTDANGIAHTYTSGHIQTWGGISGFAQALGNGLAMDFNGQPAVTGAASGLWAAYWSLGSDNSWPGTGSGGGEIDVAEFAGANESPSCSYNTYDMNAFSSAGNIGGPNSPTGTYVGVNHQFTMTNIGGRLNWYLDSGSSIYSASFPATDPFYPIIDVEYPSFACNNNASNLPSAQLTRYVRVYSRVTSGACYTSIPAHGTIPHTGTC